jgi:hypothetical protein
MSVPIITLQSWGSGRMPSKVASSIISSMQNMDNNVSIAYRNRLHGISVSDVMVTHNVREYESTAVRFSNSFSAVIRLKQLILSLTLIAPTFNTQIMQNSIEHAYQIVKEVSILSPLKTEKEKYHIIIGNPYISAELDFNMKYNIEEIKSMNCLEDLIIAQFENDINYDDNHISHDCSFLSELDTNTMIVLSQSMAIRIKATLSYSSPYISSKKINRSSITQVLR